MKFLIVVLHLLAIHDAVRAHYIFGRLIVNETITSTWEYVRPTTPGTVVNSVVDPLWQDDILKDNFRCGRSGHSTGNLTSIATVIAGSRVGFQVGEIAAQEPPYVPRIFHQGPLSFWLSKSTINELSQYQGDGEWFKIGSVTGRTKDSPVLNKNAPKMSAIWGTYWAENWNVTIPATTPPGKYLLRIEHIYPKWLTGEAYGGTQSYVNCAQVEILGSGGGKPGPTVKIPGVYKLGQPEIFWDSDTGDNQNHNFNIDTWKAPAPAVWNG